MKTGNNPLPSVPVPPARTPPVPSLPVYKAIYSFKPQESGEISFQIGDTMQIVEKADNGNIYTLAGYYLLILEAYRLVACSYQ